jgi:nicotinate-nucleotide adenylyltransferase
LKQPGVRYDQNTMPELYFGGSFNPIHIAHLRCSSQAAAAGGFERVVLVPTAQPALKNFSEIAPAADRLAMLDLAVRNWPGPTAFRVEPIEIQRGGQTYTIDTALALKARDAGPIHWLIGADQLLNLHRWHRYSELLQIVQFWVMARPGYTIDWAAVDPAARSLRSHILLADAMDISATEIRRRIAQRLPVDEWLPPGVGDYIRQHSLYS